MNDRFGVFEFWNFRFGKTFFRVPLNLTLGLRSFADKRINIVPFGVQKRNEMFSDQSARAGD